MGLPLHSVHPFLDSWKAPPARKRDCLLLCRHCVLVGVKGERSRTGVREEETRKRWNFRNDYDYRTA